MEDKEKIENKTDLKKEREKRFNRKIIIIQVIIILIFMVEVVMMVYWNNELNNKLITGGSSGSGINIQEVFTFNAQWESYVGTNQTAAQIKAMYSAVIAGNTTEVNNGKNRIVTINGSNPSELPNISGNITYNIGATYSEETGLITDLYWEIYK